MITSYSNGPKNELLKLFIKDKCINKILMKIGEKEKSSIGLFQTFQQPNYFIFILIINMDYKKS